MPATETAPTLADPHPFPTALINAEEAIARHGDFGRLWIDGMWRGDPLADAAVADGSARSIRRAIADGIDSVDDPSPALAALFAELDSPPTWLDFDRCDRGARLLVRQSREYGIVLAAASLVAGATNNVAGKPLSFTGRYAGDPAVRSIEVGSWLMAATNPGGLQRDALGFERTLRVRMIHAHVRAHLQRKPEWDAAAWGLPIPQPFMAFTLAEFCSVALRAMAQLGAGYRDDELADIHHLWRYIGHLVGVDHDFLPLTAGDYERIEDLYAMTGTGPDEGDRDFIRALAEFQAAELGRMLPGGRRPTALIQGMQRAFVGDAAADALAIPDTPWKHLPAVSAPLTRVANAVHDALVPGGAEVRTRRAFERRTVEMARLRKQYGIAHELVDDAPR